MADSFSKLKKSKLIQLAEKLQKQNGNYKKRIKKLNDFKKHYEQLNEKANELESISKVGHWKIKLPEFTFELSDEIYNIFEMERKGTELSFDNFLDFIHPTDRVDVKTTLENALRKRSKIQNAYRIITPERKIKLLYLNGKVYFKDGVPYEIFGTTQDITQIKNIDTDKWESEEKFVSILNNSANALTLSKVSDGEIIEANEAFGKLVGFSRKYLLGKRTSDLGLWKNLNDRKKLVNAVKRNSIVKNFEIQIKTKSGKEKWVLMSAELLSISGKKQYMLTTTFDISEKKKMEESLRRSEDRFKVVSNLMSDYAYEYSLDDKGRAKLEWITGALNKITGYSQEEIRKIGGWKKIVHEDDSSIPIEELEKLMKGKSATAEYRIIDKNGKVHWVKDIAKPIKDSSTGKTIGILGALKDTSKQKFTEAEVLRLNRILRTISEINQLIVRETNRDKVLSETCRILVEMGKFPMAWIGMADYATSKIIPVAQSGFPKNYLQKLDIKFDNSKKGKGIAGTAIRTGKNIICKNIETDKKFSLWWSEAESLGYRASVALPLKIDKSIIGVINVHLLDGNELTKDMIDLLDELAGDISLALRLMAQSEAREKAEESLKLANLVIENSPAVLFRWRAKPSWPVDYVSHNITQFGYTQKELLTGQVVYNDIVHPDDQNRVAAEVKSYSEAGVKNFKQEYRIVSKNGKIIWTDDRTNIIRNKNEKIVFYEGIVLDITEKKQAEIALWESKNMLSLVLDNIPQRIFWKDSNFKYLGCNKILAKDAGLNSLDEIIGKTDFDLAWKKSAELYRKDDIDIIENDIAKINFEERQISKIGKELWLRTTKIPFKDSRGNIIGILGSYEDITEKKYAEEALKESEERLRLALKSAKQGLYDLNIKTGDAIVSSEYASMLGYNPKTFQESNAKWIKRLHPDDHEITSKKYSDYISGKTSEYSVEFRQKTKSNKWTWILSQGKIVEWDEKGNPIRMLGTHTDITEKKKAEEALQESELRYRHFVDQTFDGFYRLAANKSIKLKKDQGQNYKTSFGKFRIVECNDVFASMYGYSSSEELKGLFLYEIKDGWDETLSIKSFNEFLKKGLKIINLETMEYDKFGNQKYFRNNFIGIVKDNMLVEIWGTQQDITDQKKANEAIKESEKRFRSLFEHSAIGVAQIYTDSGKFYKVNKKYGAILGYSVEEMLQLTFQDITHPDDIEKDLANMKKLTDGKITEFSMEKRYFHKNGSIVWVNLTVSPLWEPNEQKEFHMAVVEDITDKKKAEIALSESAEQYRLLFASNPNPMFVFDKETLMFLGANEAAVKHYGYSYKEFLSMTIKDIRPKEDVAAMMKVVSEFNDGITRARGYRHKKKNGEIIHVDVTSNSIIFNNRNAEVVVVYDVTDKFIAEQALRESEEKFRSVFTDSHDCIYVTSADGKLLNMNDAGLELFKLSKDQVSNQNVLDLYSNPEERDKFVEQINQEGFVKDYPIKLKNKLNTALDCLITASVKKDSNGNVLSYQGIIRDITKQKKSERELVVAKEQAERADRLKTEFLAQMSHEIRTPINTLLSFSSLIQEETKDYITDDLKQYFHYQISAGNRIIRTIDLVLNMSEIQTGSFQLNIAEFNLADLINEIYNDYKSIAEQNGLVINLFSQEDNLKIKADEYSVHQIFSNLIDNSIKYTPEGSVTLTAKKEKKHAIIEVIDTGIGMTEEYLQNIFKPFTQEEQGYTRKFEGSGLGLSLVKKYCEFNNAEIRVESKKNVGSKFIVSFNLME